MARRSTSWRLPAGPGDDRERRHLTVVFCDLVESTALAARLDPEDWRDAVMAYHQTASAVVVRYDGHVAQLLGDGLLIYFGYPRAHEDDVARTTVRKQRAIEPPLTKGYKPKPASVAGLDWLEKMDELWEHLRNETLLCWPADPISAPWADLLFYMPHNSCRLMDLTASMSADPNQSYRFDTPALKDLVDRFQSDLRALDKTLAADPRLYFVPLADIASSIQY